MTLAHRILFAAASAAVFTAVGIAWWETSHPTPPPASAAAAEPDPDAKPTAAALLPGFITATETGPDSDRFTALAQACAAADSITTALPPDQSQWVLDHCTSTWVGRPALIPRYDTRIGRAYQ